MSGPSSIAAAKRALRAQVRARRAAIAPDRRAEAALAIAGIDFSVLPLPEAAVVSGYYPLRDELDPLPLLERLRIAGVATALPAHAPNATDLTFHDWRAGDALLAGDFDVAMPTPTAPRVEPDVLLVPLLAFDAQGNRLGYGKGYFDRALARLRAVKTITAVGVGFDEQEVGAVPHEPWDQRLDWVLTPRGARPTPG